MLFLYTNEDSLPNKLQELKQLIVHLEILESIVRDTGQLFIKRLLTSTVYKRGIYCVATTQNYG